MYATELSPWLVRGLAFLWGALWGSFFNVAIYRWPREMSVVSPPSHCPACGEPIPAFRNVPILGYFMLRGKAACCGATLSSRYPMVELLSAALCLAVAEQYVVRAAPDALWHEAALVALVYFAFVGGLLIVTFVDLEWMEIPDEVSLPGAALGLVTATLRPEPGVVDCAIGAGAGYLVVQFVFVWGYERLTGRRGMGEGDSKLLLMIGAFLGWRGALFAVVAGALQGLVVAAVMLAAGRSVTPERPDAEDGDADEQDEEERDDEDAERDEDETVGALKIPYGPFLALAALEYLFFGNWILERYFELFM